MSSKENTGNSRFAVFASIVAVVTSVLSVWYTNGQMTIAREQLEVALADLEESRSQGDLGKQIVLTYDLGTFNVPVKATENGFSMTSQSNVLRMGNFGGSPAIHTWIHVTVTRIDGMNVDKPKTHRYQMPSISPNQTIAVRFVPEELLQVNGPKKVEGHFTLGCQTYKSEDHPGPQYTFAATAHFTDPNGPYAEVIIDSNDDNEFYFFR